jgi:hypothetical protein
MLWQRTALPAQDLSAMRLELPAQGFQHAATT